MDHEITYEEMLELTKTFKQKLGFFKIQQEFTPQCPVEHYESISKVLKDLQNNIDELLLALTEKQLGTVERRIKTLQNRHADGNNTDSGISCSSIVSTSSVRFSETEIGGTRMSAITIHTQKTEAPAIVSTNKAIEHEDTCYDEKSHPLKKDSLKPEPIVAHPADESSSEEENVGACAMRENEQHGVKNHSHSRALVIPHEDLDTTAENSENQEDDENYPDDSYA